jgi:hypothetical protein
MSHKVSTAVYEHSRSKGSARLVLLAMADEAHSSGDLTAYARSYTHLARKANVSKNSVRVAIRSLEALGELQVLREGDGRSSSDYRIVLPGLGPEGTQSEHPGVADRVPRVRHPSTQGAQDEHPIIPFSPGDPPSSPPSDLSASFEDFWRAYPRRGVKAEAKKVWTAAVRAAGGPEPIIEGARRYAADPNLPEPQFIPHAKRWLTGQRWEDEPLPPRSNGNGSVGARTVANVTAMHQRRALGPPPTALDRWAEQRELLP